jgi:hypothetical protein
MAAHFATNDIKDMIVPLIQSGKINMRIDTLHNCLVKKSTQDNLHLSVVEMNRNFEKNIHLLLLKNHLLRQNITVG